MIAPVKNNIASFRNNFKRCYYTRKSSNKGFESLWRENIYKIYNRYINLFLFKKKCITAYAGITFHRDRRPSFVHFALDALYETCPRPSSEINVRAFVQARVPSMGPLTIIRVKLRQEKGRYKGEGNERFFQERLSAYRCPVLARLLLSF